VRRRVSWWMVVALLAAGCAASGSKGPAASDETDVWFLQHMVPHLLQTTAILDLARERITRPELARLADTINQQGQAHLQQLQGWLASRGLAPYDPQQDPNRGKKTDLMRLSRVRGAGFDLAFLQVMTARHRAGLRLAAAEAREGGVPEVRELARQMVAEQRFQLAKLTVWRRAWSTAATKPAANNHP
jgi:uncharacterized protein (DUF305 family)